MGLPKTDFRISDHKRGTTWYGLSIILTETLDSGVKAPVDLTGAVVTAEFSKNPGNTSSFAYSTENQTLLFGPKEGSNPASGEVMFKPELITHQAYDYYLRIYVQFSNTDKDLILEGYWNITE
jgi:hypothetical protein